MAIGHLSNDNASRVYTEYWLDWMIIHRTPEELLQMVETLPDPRIEILYDKTGIQMFLKITKQVVDGED
jgi:extracellular factor (EF) 3-hydroxypalmitic acid methyl ester biosynthesis protein